MNGKTEQGIERLGGVL